MRTLIAEVRACQGCGACLLTCPEHAIRPTAAPGATAATLAVDPGRCTGCGECAEVCPVDAIAMLERPSDAIAMLERPSPTKPEPTR